jgi:hypothetical protein
MHSAGGNASIRKGFARRAGTLADTADDAVNFAAFIGYCRRSGAASGVQKTWS